MVAPTHAAGARQRGSPRGTRRSGPRPWLTAAAVARATGGEILRRGRAAREVTTDSRGDCSGSLFLALVGERHDGHDHVGAAVRAGARGAIVCRDVPLDGLPEELTLVRVPDTARALMELAAVHRGRHDVEVVGITGSCGKTSTKEMLGEVLSAALPAVRSPASFNNAVGVPLTLFRIRPRTRAAVVEMGTNAPGEIAALAEVAAPDVGIVTCVSPAHLAGLQSLDGVAAEKAALVEALPGSGLAILNGDDASCRRMAERTRARVELVRLDREADWFATDVRFTGMGTSFRLHGERPVTLPRLGTHNVYNALFTLAAAHRLGVDTERALEVLGRLPAAQRRLECKRAGEVVVYDDTYNMNPASAHAALVALAGLPGNGRRIVAFGAMHELGDRTEELHRELGAEVHRSGVDLLLCVGPGSAPIAAGARDAGMTRGRVLEAGDPHDALERLSGLLRPGDHVLCKASRRVALDRLVDGLLARLAPPSTG